MPYRRKSTPVLLTVILGIALFLTCSAVAIADEVASDEAPDETVVVVDEQTVVAGEEDNSPEEGSSEESASVEPEAAAIDEPAVEGQDNTAELEGQAEEDLEAQTADQEEGELKQAAASSISYAAHVQNVGWQQAVRDGKTAGTSGRSLRVEGMTFELLDAAGEHVDGVRYRSHVQSIGWQGWVKDGAQTGTSGRSLRVEAVKLELYGEAAEQYDAYYRVHVQNYGWLAWAKNGESAGSSGRSLRVEAIQVVLCEKGGAAPSASGSVSDQAFIDGSSVVVSAHCQNVGWQAEKRFGETAGTTGRGLRMEAFKATLSGYEATGGITYQAHVQNIGWQDEVSDGKVAGTTGRSLRVEAVRFRLTGEMAQLYDVYYRAHVEGFGWLAWTKNGATAGTTGLSRRIEAMQVKVVRKGDASAPSTSGASYLGSVGVTYSVDVAGQGWQAQKKDGATAGNAGGTLAIERVTTSVSIPEDSGLAGGITYRACLSGSGWQDAVSDGAPAGSDLTQRGGNTSEDRGIEAVRFELTTDLAKYYDVYYRAYVDGFGWLSWACNGASAGTSDFGYPIRGLQVKVLPKGTSQSDTSTPYVDKGSNSVGQLLSEANAKQKRVVSAAGSVPSPGGGLCAEWISEVGEAGGVGRFYNLDACDMYDAYCTSTDRSQLKVGMIVSVSKHNRTYMGSIYGHVALYVGDGWVMDNVGYIRKMRLNEWVSWYGQVVPVKWGWLGNVKLS